MNTRNIVKTIRGQRTVDGAGVHLVRVLGRADVQDIDPFLMLDAFDSTNPADYIKGFPLHPHRGIETFTYLVSGEMDHRDTLGNSGRIMGGQAQWMNSGSGILHEEMPVATDRLWGFQIWINLPKDSKMCTPTYHDITRADMPHVEEEGVTVRVVAGNYKETQGPGGQYVQPTVLDITMKPDSEFSMQVPSSDTLFIYMMQGDCAFGLPPQNIELHTVAVFGPGEELVAKTGGEEARFMLFSGAPLHEPIAWAGPIVMNDQRELEEAFRELEEGTFIK